MSGGGLARWGGCNGVEICFEHSERTISVLVRRTSRIATIEADQSIAK
jgi:hypothetical protein